MTCDNCIFSLYMSQDIPVIPGEVVQQCLSELESSDSTMYCSTSDEETEHNRLPAADYLFLPPGPAQYHSPTSPVVSPEPLWNSEFSTDTPSTSSNSPSVETSQPTSSTTTKKEKEKKLKTGESKHLPSQFILIFSN